MSNDEKVRLGIVGVGGRGFGAHLKTFSMFDDVEIAAVCDVDQGHLDRAVEYTGGTAKGYRDFRELVANSSIDAVTVATPPHWHALVSLAALEARKDVYCEKPMSRFPVEGKLMADYAKRFNRVTQVGTQIYATENYHKCVDVVRSGRLGRIVAVRNFCTMSDHSEGLGQPENSAPPIGLDWDMWLGPAPQVEYNIGRFRDGMHRYFKDYVDSWLHELGPHIVDLPFWALQAGVPCATTASGGRYATESIADVPDTMEVLWEFPEMIMTWSMMQSNSFNFGVGKPGPGRRLGIVFHGTEGTLLANYGLCEVLDPKGNVVTGDTYPKSAPDSPGHEREFIDCVKSRSECSCSFQNHLPMHTALNLAHVALQTGRKLHFDAEKWEVRDDAEATAMLTPTYRAPWKLPTA